MIDPPFHAGAAARVTCLDPDKGTFGVILARRPLEPNLDALTRRGTLWAMIRHDRGVVWPDRIGRELARIALERDGAALLQFASLADAMACKLRLNRETTP